MEPRSHACGFGRDARICGTDGFDHCLKQAAFYRSGAFAFHLAFGDAPGWRLGLVIPKRYEPRSVARNTIKRRWRDAFRVRREAWAREFGGADLVIRMHSPLSPTPKPIAAKARGARPVVARQKHERFAFDAGAMLTALAERLRSRGAGQRGSSPGKS